MSDPTADAPSHQERQIKHARVAEYLDSHDLDAVLLSKPTDWPTIDVEWAGKSMARPAILTP